MNNFSINDDATRNEIAQVAKAAKAANLSSDKLASSADASFAYQNGDKLTIPAQVAKIVSLTGTMLTDAQANKTATGYFSFNAYVTRSGKKLPCRVSAKQLFTPTVWLDATKDESKTVPNHDDEALYTAPFREGKKRFGEQGAVTIVNGIPVIENDIEVTLETVTAYLPVFLKEEERKSLGVGNTGLRQREDYAVAR